MKPLLPLLGLLLGLLLDVLLPEFRLLLFVWFGLVLALPTVVELCEPGFEAAPGCCIPVIMGELC